jgi:hypothetical protein
MRVARVDKPPDGFMLWECLSPEAKQLLRQLMPADWQPGRHPELEDTEEIGRIMKRKPDYPKEYYRT